MSGEVCTTMSLREWATATLDPLTVELMQVALPLNHHLSFRLDAWIAANRLCENLGIKDLEDRQDLISELALALEETYE